MAGVRVALVGAGNIADRYAAAIARVDDVDLAGATDLDHTRAEALVAEFGGRAYTDLAAELRDERLGAGMVEIRRTGEVDVVHTCDRGRVPICDVAGSDQCDSHASHPSSVLRITAISSLGS